MKQKTLYLLDTSSLFFRAYYAVSHHLQSPGGMPTNALYGFLSMITKFLKDHQPEYMVCCMDSETPSFRTKIYPLYKAHRGETPEDLKTQIPYIQKLIQAMGVPMLKKPGYEADDIIGTLSSLGLKHQLKILIVSGDKDFAQLIGPAVSLYDPMRNITYDSKKAFEKWGVLPEQMTDYLSLVGDSTDNIPGVRGIGPKSAQKLLKEYKNLPAIYDHIKQIPEKLAKKLSQSQTEAFLSQKLVRIVTDMSLPELTHRQATKKSAPPTKEQMTHFIQYKKSKNTELKNLLEELGFKSFAVKLCGENATSSPAKPSTDKKETLSPSSQGVLKKLPGNLRVHFMSFPELKKFICTYRPVWLFQDSNNEWFLAHQNRTISLKGHNLSQTGKWLSYKRVKWCGYDLKNIFTQFSCTHPVPGWCALVAAYTLQSRPISSFEYLCKGYGFSVSPKTSPGELYQIHQKLKKKLTEDLQTQNLWDMYGNTELPLTAVLFEMEQKGIQLNSQKLKQHSQLINRQLSEMEKEIFSYTEGPFNLASPKQMSSVLFHKLGLKHGRKTKTGYSTDMDVLLKLKNQHPAIPLILKYRELFKLKNTYVDVLPTLVNKTTGRLHTHFRQTLTSTGRLSSVKPNLQNIPIKTSQGQKVRTAFEAKKNHSLISADYSQIELRMLAHLSGDKNLIKAFHAGKDIHLITASEIYDLPLKKVSPALRHRAKTINFGLMYGQGPYTLSSELGISTGEAQTIIDNYFKKFEGVKKYREQLLRQAEKQGYVQTLSGRKRQIPELKAAKFHNQQAARRIAINTPVQGSASEIVKEVMVELRKSVFSRLLLQIHDELLFECEDHLVKEECLHIQHIMEKHQTLKVPLKVHIACGKNWLQAHPL